jgi:hypothetical protein
MDEAGIDVSVVVNFAWQMPTPPSHQRLHPESQLRAAVVVLRLFALGDGPRRAERCVALGARGLAVAPAPGL